MKKVILPITSVLLFTSCETEGIKPEIEQIDTDYTVLVKKGKKNKILICHKRKIVSE